MGTKTTMKYQYASIRMTEIKKTENTSVAESWSN